MGTYCRYIKKIEYYSIDGGKTWRESGYVTKGDWIGDGDGICQDPIWEWKDTSGHVCDVCTQERFVKTNDTVCVEPTNVEWRTVDGYICEECEPLEKWETVDGYICDSCQQVRYVKTNNVICIEK